MSDARLTDSVIIDAALILAGRWPTPAKAAGEVRAWFFGDDYGTWTTIRDTAPAPYRPVPVGPRLNAVAARIADGLIDLEDQLRHGHGRLAWDASDIADRGPYVSRLQINACRAIVLIEALKAGGPNLFVVADPQFGDALVRIARRAGFPVVRRRAGPRSAILPWAKSLMAAWHSRLSGVRDLLSRCAALRALRRTHPLPLDRLRQADVLVLTWARAGSFPADSPLRTDSYLGPLPGILRDAGLQVGFIGHGMNWLEYFGGIAHGAVGAADPVLMVEDCLSRRAVIRAVLASLRPAIPPWRRLRLDGHDLTPLVGLEVRRELSGFRPAWSRCLGEVGRFLARHDIRPGTLVFVYENQPWEKCLRHGILRDLPGTRLIAVQHTPFAPHYLCFFPSRQEIRTGGLPDELIVCNDHARDLFLARGYPPDRLVVGGALRFGERRPIRAKGSGGSSRTVLCCTGIDLDEAVELAAKCIAAVAGEPDIRLLVNFHPSVTPGDRDTVRQRLGFGLAASPPYVAFSDAPFGALLPDADAVVYHSSAAGSEAAAAGVPVVFVGHDVTLDFDKLSPGLAERACAPEEIRAALVRALERGTTAPEVADSLFPPVSAAAIIAAVTRHFPRRSHTPAEFA